MEEHPSGWDDRALFDQPIEAWANRRALGKLHLSEWPYGGPNALDKRQVATVSAVHRFYAKAMRSNPAT